MLASNWATLAHLEAMLGDVGAKMADKIGKMAIKSAKIADKIGKKAIKSAKMSQDGETCWQCSAPARGLPHQPRRAGGRGGGSKA